MSGGRFPMGRVVLIASLVIGGSATAALATHSNSGRGPTVSALLSVSATSPNDVWAVGYRAAGAASATLVEHFDGETWTTVPSPNPGGSGLNRLDGVDAIASDDVWAVGTFDAKRDNRLHNLAMHWDGSSWSVESPPEPAPHRRNALLTVGGSGSDNVWAGGYFVDADGYTLASLYHWDGSNWSPAQLLHGPVGDPVEGVSVFQNSAWAVGECTSGCSSVGNNGFIAHFTGIKWKLERTPDLGHVSDVAGTSDSDLWVVGDGRTSHFDGTSWTRVPSVRIGPLSAVSDVGFANPIAVASEAAENWDGSRWTRVRTPRVGHLYDVEIDGANDGWAVGTTGRSVLLERWDGSKFVRVT